MYENTTGFDLLGHDCFRLVEGSTNLLPTLQALEHAERMVNTYY
jgi:hypothetical protein